MRHKHGKHSPREVRTWNWELANKKRGWRGISRRLFLTADNVRNRKREVRVDIHPSSDQTAQKSQQNSLAENDQIIPFRRGYCYQQRPFNGIIHCRQRPNINYTQAEIKKVHRGVSVRRRGAAGDSLDFSLSSLSDGNEWLESFKSMQKISQEVANYRRQTCFVSTEWWSRASTSLVYKTSDEMSRGRFWAKDVDRWMTGSGLPAPPAVVHRTQDAGHKIMREFFQLILTITSMTATMRQLWSRLLEVWLNTFWSQDQVWESVLDYEAWWSSQIWSQPWSIISGSWSMVSEQRRL